MDAFERLVATLLEAEGFWVRSSYKVRLRSGEKQQIGRPSSLRWEIDLVAYKAATNELRLVECKSYLDSGGVRIEAFGENERFSRRFKILNDPDPRRIVQRRLVRQLTMSGACAARPRVTWCLVAGKIATERSRKALHERFCGEGWLLLDDEWLAAGLRRMASDGYQNDIGIMVAKLLFRNPVLFGGSSETQ